MSDRKKAAGLPRVRRLRRRKMENSFGGTIHLKNADGIARVSDLYYWLLTTTRSNFVASILSAMKSLGFADDARVKTMNAALGGLYEVVANDKAYRPDEFVQALHKFETTLPK